MPKVKVTNSEGQSTFVEKNGILSTKVVTSQKEGKNKGKSFISIDYGSAGQTMVGPFNQVMDAENVIVNDL